MKFDIENLKTLVKSMEENNISELAFEDEEMKLKLKRGYESVERAEREYIIPATTSHINYEEKTEVLSEETNTYDSMHSIDSPMVGTFYSKPSPDAESYVKQGDMVEEGQVLCIVEAMKMMNEIKSDKSGKVAKVMFGDGQAVKKGDKLFLID